MVCVFLLGVCFDDFCLNVMFGYVVVGYVKSVCVFVSPFLLRMGV